MLGRRYDAVTPTLRACSNFLVFRQICVPQFTRPDLLARPKLHLSPGVIVGSFLSTGSARAAYGCRKQGWQLLQLGPACSTAQSPEGEPCRLYAINASDLMEACENVHAAQGRWVVPAGCTKLQQRKQNPTFWCGICCALAGGTNGCRPQAVASLSHHDGSMQLRECHSRTLRAKYGRQPCALFTWQHQQLRTSTTRTAFSTSPGADAAESASAGQQDAQHSHTSRSGPDAAAQPHATGYDRWQSILQKQPHLQSFESPGACSTASSSFPLNYNPAQQLQEQASAQQPQQQDPQQPDHQTTPHPDAAQQQQQPPAQQPWPPYPEEVLLIGVDPDTNGAIAVIHSQLHWTTTAPRSTAAAAAAVPSGKRRQRKTNESSNRTSSSRSNSTEEVPHVQAHTALPAAAVKVYDMPVETIVTKTKTQTGKVRIRR